MSPDEYGPDRPPEGYGADRPPAGYGTESRPQGYGSEPPPGGQIPPGPPPGYGPPQGYGPERRRPEKQDEKQQEKEAEKQQEKGKNLDEKYKRNPLGVLSWAFLIIWLGVSLLLMNADIIADDDKGWAVFAWGGGVIILIEAVLRVLVPKWRRSVVGSFIWGAVWIGVGFGLWFDKWEVIGPIVIIAIGVAILLGRLMPRR